jgi:hypothetical protein
MSEFPEIQPFGPRPAQPKDNPLAPAQATPTTPTAPAQIVPQNSVNIPVVVTAVTVGFALGFLFSRYQQAILNQDKIDEFINYAQSWIREQGPKISDPIKQGLESTGSTVEQAFKKVSASRPLESLHLFQRRKPRGLFGLDIF